MAEPKKPKSDMEAEGAPWEHGTSDIVADKDLISQEVEVGDGVFRKGLRVLDYLGGATRTNLADALASMGVIGSDVVKDSEKNSGYRLQGDFPSTAEMMERAGVPAGPGVVPLVPERFQDWNPSARTMAGFAGDILLDPSTYAGVGLWTSLLKLPKAGNAVRAVLRPGLGFLQERPKILSKVLPAFPFAKDTFRTGLKDLDRAGHISNKGQNAVSDLFWDKDWWGTSKNLYDKSVNEVENVLMPQVSELVSKADMAGAKPNMGRAMYPALSVISEVADNPYTKSMAPEMQSIVDGFLSKSPNGARRMSEWKSQIYGDIGSGPYKIDARNPLGMKYKKSLARGLKDEVERSANEAMPGLGDEIAKKNAEMGILLSTAKAMEKDAWKGQNKNFLTSVDPFIAAIGSLGYGAPGSAGWLAAKKAADAMKTTAVRTGYGMALKNLYQGDLAYPLWKRMMIQATQKAEPGSEEEFLQIMDTIPNEGEGAPWEQR